MTKGVVYTVWGNDHDPDLERSIASLKKYNPTLPYEVFRMGETSQHDMVKKLDIRDDSPFELTLFLDADTVILGNLDYGFLKAEQHNMAICLERACYVNRWEKFFPGWDTGDLIEYNTGVIFFKRDDPKIIELFNKWKEIAIYLKNRLGCTWNQPSFALAVDALDFNPFVLPNNVWNLRDYDDGCLFGPVKIWHTRIQEVDELLEKKLTNKNGWDFYNIKDRKKLERKTI